MIQTRNAAELIDYLVLMGIVNPAYRDKLVKSPFGPIASRMDTGQGYKSMQLFIEHGGPAGTYKLDGYTARVVKFPAYDHVVSQHMSTADLEERLATVDWNKESYKINIGGDNAVANVFNDALFLRLAGNGPARDIVDILLLKYCDITPAISMVPYNLYDKPFIREINVPLDYGIRDLKLSQAWNLLEERAVMKFKISGDKDSGVWYRYNGAEMVEYPQFDLAGVLQALPIIGNPSYEQRLPHFLKLINGDQVEVKLRQSAGKAQPAVLEADPGTAGIVGTDEKGNALRFDRVNTVVPAKHKDVARQHQAKKKKGKNKGRLL